MRLPYIILLLFFSLFISCSKNNSILVSKIKKYITGKESQIERVDSMYVSIDTITAKKTKEYLAREYQIKEGQADFDESKKYQASIWENDYKKILEEAQKEDNMKVLGYKARVIAFFTKSTTEQGTTKFYLYFDENSQIVKQNYFYNTLFPELQNDNLILEEKLKVDDYMIKFYHNEALKNTNRI